MEVTAKTLVRRALRLFGKEGRTWTKGTLKKPCNYGIAYCSLGALTEATRQLGAPRSLYEEARELVRDSIANDRANGGVGKSIINFNDSKRITFDDIKRVFGRVVRGERRPVA